MKNPFEPIWNVLNAIFREGLEKFGKYYSSYRGFVVENEDPEGFGRLKLVIPQVTGKSALDYWAWPKGNFSGENYGSQVIPSKGDMVWVEFEMGNPRVPIWDYGHFSFKEDGKTPQKPEELKDIKNYWFMTPKGHRVELDDTNLKIVVTLLEKLLLGDKDVTEPAVLGNVLKAKLESLCTKTATACTKAQSLSTKVAQITVPTPLGPSGVPINAPEFGQLATEFAVIKSEIDTLKDSLGGTLSEFIFLK